ncbi:hypothetical protein CBA19CS42_35570 [Caballeronia novacaledonica]|uniref:Uncharacterized protein n=1 Tax=Caballeronia novacaledonica TaxID=1544861 RepID=A0AA37MUT7_9BURK|nr:hypothetical protein CBA19CS42_35570 [Caballeronia novacaledonica]
MYTASIGATVIILVILAGMKPLERRFISVKQQRSIQLRADRGAVSLRTLHEALGSASVRVKQFIVQQSEDDPEVDEIQIELSRTTANDFEVIAQRLMSMNGVRSTKPDTR